MNAYSESTYLGDVLKCEAPNLYSREAVTVLAGGAAARVLKAGAVIARRICTGQINVELSRIQFEPPPKPSTNIFVDAMIYLTSVFG